MSSNQPIYSFNPDNLERKKKAEKVHACVERVWLFEFVYRSEKMDFSRFFEIVYIILMSDKEN